MSAHPTNDPRPGASAPGPAEDAPVPAPGPDRPHGDPLTGDEGGSRHGGTPGPGTAGPGEEQQAPGGSPAAEPDDEAGATASPGAGGADAPPVDPGPSADESEASGDDPLSAAEARAAQYLDLAQRRQAEFENFRRRMNQQVAQAEERGVTKLAKELLPALDHLDRALEAAEQHAGTEEWVRGIRLVQEEVAGALARVGIQAFSPVGEPFDPNEHEAMVQVPAEGFEPGTVAQVYQQGYRLNGTVLRPARVVVAQ